MFFFFTAPLDPKLTSGPRWEALERALDVVRSKYPTMTVGTFRTFLAIARNWKTIKDGGLTLRETAKLLGTASATFSRQTDVMGAGVPGKQGFGLVLKTQAPGNNKTKCLEFTPAGVALVEEIEKLLSSEEA